MPTCDGDDDFGGVDGPREGFGLQDLLIEEASYGGLQIDDGSENAAL